MNRSVFIDKDGTLIPDIPYNVNPDLIALSPGTKKVLRRLKNQGYLLVVISNQSGVAQGIFEESALPAVRTRIESLLGFMLDGFYYCPHLPDAKIDHYKRECDCRKPKAGLLQRAARDLNIDLRQSWMIGDIATDSEAGNRAGCKTILIEKAYDPIKDLNEINQPGFIVTDWNEVGRIV